MILYPGIDIKGGGCVRLYQGDFARATTYANDPVNVAKRWADAGAEWLHVVDLDAAADAGDNGAIVAAIVRAVSIPVQFGGGVRDAASLARAFDRGVARAVIGTAAVESPAFAREAIERWGDRVAFGVDARNGRVAIHGWRQTADRLVTELVAELEAWGATRIIYTDIERDGTLTQPNWTALYQLLSTRRLRVIASGGVASLDHLLRLRQLGAEGAIVGRALYTGDLDLPRALAALKTVEAADGAVVEG